MARFHRIVSELVDDPSRVVIATETDRGLFIGALVVAGYQVLAVNPMSTSRHRERHSTSGAKSDPGDAKVLADLARTDRHNHRPVAGDSDLAAAVKTLARGHQSLIWTRQRQTNQLRSTLREFLSGLGMILGARCRHVSWDRGQDGSSRAGDGTTAMRDPRPTTGDRSSAAGDSPAGQT